MIKYFVTFVQITLTCVSNLCVDIELTIKLNIHYDYNEDSSTLHIDELIYLKRNTRRMFIYQRTIYIKQQKFQNNFFIIIKTF